MSSVTTLLQKIQALPAERVGEVEDFVDFLTVKARRKQALGLFLEAARRIHDAKIPPLSIEEIDAEVKADRVERRAFSGVRSGYTVLKRKEVGYATLTHPTSGDDGTWRTA